MYMTTDIILRILCFVAVLLMLFKYVIKYRGHKSDKAFSNKNGTAYNFNKKDLIASIIVDLIALPLMIYYVICGMVF